MDENLTLRRVTERRGLRLAKWKTALRGRQFMPGGIRWVRA